MEYSKLLSKLESIDINLRNEFEINNTLDANKLSYKFDEDDFKKKFDKTNDIEFFDTIIFNPTHFEQLVSLQTAINYPMRETNIKIESDQIVYEVSKPSSEFILSSFIKFFQGTEYCSLFLASSPQLNMNSSRENVNSILKRNFRFAIRGLRNIHSRNHLSNTYRSSGKDASKKEGSNTTITSDNLLRELFKRALTVKITSNRELLFDEYQTLLTSFIFSLNYNRSLPLTEFRNVENLIKPPSRLHFNEMEVPKRAYNQKPLYYYQQALATDNPVLEFLSFYQVIEYFFEIVSQENLIEGVKMRITHPHFSSKNDERIKHLVKFVKGSEDRYKEKNALRLVLKKYLDVDELKNDLREYDVKYFEYLMNEEVNFADAPSLEVVEGESFIQKLAERIYSVRNSLIHSKEGEKNAYIPFSDDEDKLVKELILMRFIAEQIIINDSKELKI